MRNEIDFATYLGHEVYLHSFFNKLNSAGICTTKQLENYTVEELFKIAPTSLKNQRRFLNCIDSGLIEVKK